MSRVDVMIGRTAGGATVATIQGVIVLIISMLFGFQPVSWWAIIPAIFIMFLIALIFSSIGTIIGSILDDMQAFSLIINFLVMPMFFLSGALFTLSGLPNWLSFISRIDPLTYGVDALRVLLADIGHTDLGLGTDTIVLIAVAVVCSLIGGYFFNEIQI
jgi:ABC-2 type transport system permease protein